MHGHTLILIVEDDPELGARLTRDVRRYAGASAAELVQECEEAIARLHNPPVPPFVSAAMSCTWLKGWKSFAICSGARPRPLSTTRTAA